MTQSTAIAMPLTATATSRARSHHGTSSIPSIPLRPAGSRCLGVTHAPAAHAHRSTATARIALSLLLAWCGGLPTAAQRQAEYDLPPTHYSTAEANNRITRLQARIDSGEIHLAGASTREPLLEWLEALAVPPETQLLVFSKTSLQRHRIHPTSPRALYFSDDVYVGWVPGGILEIAASDPKLGLVFYRVDTHRDRRPPRLHRDHQCLSCHAGPLTRQWPALMVRSVFPDHDGEPIGRAGSFLTDHTSPFHERWGGWYVTGHHGDARHMGNATAQADNSVVSLDREAGANLAQLNPEIPTARYPRHDSDLVALMVFEHQITIHNRLSEGALRVKRWLHYQHALQAELGQPVTDEPVGIALKVVQDETRRIVEALLFHGEAPLPKGGVSGNPDFPTAFQANRRVDSHGRSLKDLNLQTRLFEYRCSYMIHSEAFASLPPPLKTAVYHALDHGLTHPHPKAPFDQLPLPERIAIHQILTDTEPNWRTQEP